MSTKISLSLLVITGALLSAKAVPAQNSFQTVKNLVANNTLKTDLSGINNLTDSDAGNTETSQVGKYSSQTVSHNFSPVDRDLASPRSNVLNTLSNQTNSFSSDVAVLDRRTTISATPSSERPELSIEIFVPKPRTQVIKGKFVPYLPQAAKTNPLPNLPQAAKTNSLPSVTEISPNAIEIPVAPPLAGMPAPIAKPTAFVNNGTNNSSIELIYPLLNPAKVTSRFGWRTHPLTGSRRFHSGVDIGAPSGAPVVAAGSGTVVSAGWNGGYGKAVIIQHNDTQQTLYGHLSEVSVQAGQTIAKGTVIGLVGSTGNSTGPHLHFERRMPSATGLWAAVDPSEEIQYAVDNLRRSAPFAQRDLPPGL